MDSGFCPNKAPAALRCPDSLEAAIPGADRFVRTATQAPATCRIARLRSRIGLRTRGAWR